MAQSMSSVETIIKKAYGLQVAVRCTSEAEFLCRKNLLTFSELLQPFSHLESPVQTRDLQGHSYSLKNVFVNFSDPQLEPAPASELQKLLSEAVKEGGWEGKQPLIRYGNITTNATTPWYDGYRDQYLGRQRAEDREPIRHYISVLLVVSSSEANVMEAFGSLYSKQKESEQSGTGTWLTPHMFYYHILLHDVIEGDRATAEDKLTKVQATYGSGSCFLLPVNSRRPGSVVLGENPWGRVARHYTTNSNSNGEDETDGVAARIKFSLTGKRRKNKKSSPKILPSENPAPTNHSPAPPPPSTSSPSSSLSSSTTTPIPPSLPKTSISPPPSISSNASLPALPTDTHPLLEDAAPANHDLVTSSLPHPLPPTPPPNLITPNVREEARLEQSSSEESLAEDEQEEEEEEKVGGGGEGRGANKVVGTTQKDVGRCLSVEDEGRVRSFVTEFVAQRLVPHLEAVLKNLNEWLISRRSVRRSISTMSKRFFGMLGGQMNNTAIEEPSYTASSQEFQTRQFADLLFLLQSYDSAYTNYSSVRKDFHSSSAWFHYAKALEMCAVTAYMLSSTKRDIIAFFDDAVNMYTSICKSQVNAARCAMFQSEVLKERGMYRELTQVCIKMTTEDSDLHSAVCLEQAAHAFLRIHPAMFRKYALHLILAGHRFAKAGQRVHSARAYTQALEIYRDKGWALAEDYIHFSLARHCFALKRLRDARLAFEHLLGHDGLQSPQQQLLNLREYIYVHKLLLSDSDYCSGQQVDLGPGSVTSVTSADRIQSVPLLPVPFAKSSSARVIIQTGLSSERLNTLMTANTQREREEERGGGGGEGEGRGEESGERRGKEIARPLTPARIRKIIQQLSTELNQNTSDGNRDPKPLIVGTRDFNPQQVRGSTEEWRGLEEVASRGPQGTPHENFQPSVVMMNEFTCNSRVPTCVVNETVSVGIVLRNPLKVPLLMKGVALTWSHTPLTTPTSGGGGGEEGVERAKAEVLERLVLQPQTEKMIVLRVTPVSEGEMDILGIIYRLCVDQQLTGVAGSGEGGKGAESPSLSTRTSLPSLGVPGGRDSVYQKQGNQRVQRTLAEGVQGRIEFSVRGPRMNLTKEHKTGVIYGPDHRLHWRVTTPMPRALVRVSGLPSSVLCGEVRRVMVEVINCGEVPLNSLRLTSSFGRRLLLDSREKVSSPGSVYPSALSSSSNSSSLLSPPPSSPPCIELPLPSGRLEPGGGVSVGVVLQAVDPQERDEIPLNLLFYYEPTLITSHTTMSHRVLQYSHVLSLRESLVLKTTATPTQSPVTSTNDSNRFDLNQLVVLLEAENKCQQAVELRILQVSCISHRWSVQSMDQSQGVASLFPKETAIIPLKASCLFSSSSATSSSATASSSSSTSAKTVPGHKPRRNLCLSDVPLGPLAIPSQEFPVLDLVTADEAYAQLMGVVREREDGGGGGGGGGGGREESGEHNDIMLIVFWQALVSQGSDVVHSYGHHTVPVRLPQSMSLLSHQPTPKSQSSPSQSPYDLVKHYLQHPTSLVHSFSAMTEAACRTPVSITLQNCSHATVEVAVEFFNPREVSDSKTGSKYSISESSVVWTGATSQRHISLSADSLETFTVFANFTRTGVYNLQGVKVWARPAGARGDFHLQRWQRTSLISVVVE